MRIAECTAAVDFISYSTIRVPHSFLIPLMRPVIFDTDIGTAVDDILALILLAKAPALQLLGVTTVYGNTLLRALIAQITSDLLRRKETRMPQAATQTLTARELSLP